MKLLPSLALTLALGAGSVAVLHAQDAPTTKPASKLMKTPKMSGIWAKMGSLTPEQKQQIGAIHKKALADKKAIDEKEQDDCMALLTADQKTEAQSLMDAGTTAKKKAAAPSTQPDAAPGA